MVDEHIPIMHFKSNPLYAFFNTAMYTFMFPNRTRESLGAFNSDTLNALLSIKVEKDIIRKLDKIRKPWPFDENADFLELKKILKTTSCMSDSSLTILENAYKEYQAFYHQNKERIRLNIGTIQRAKSVYTPILQKLCSSLNVAMEKSIPCYLSPTPGRVPLSGLCTGFDTTVYYSLKNAELPPCSRQTEKTQASDISMDVIGTVVHEATHFIWHQSDKFKDLKSQKDTFIKNRPNSDNNSDNSGIRKLFNHLISICPSGRNTSDFIISLIDETFATCASVMFDEILGGKLPDDDKWYWGFPAANDFARHMYPFFKEYVANGRQIDDNFFGCICNSMNKDKKHLVLQLAQRKQQNG